MRLSQQELENFLWEQPKACLAQGLAIWQAFFALGRRYRCLSLGPYGEAQQVNVRFDPATKCYHVQLVIAYTGAIGPGNYFKAKRQLSALYQLLHQATRAESVKPTISLQCVLVGQDVGTASDFVFALNLDAECKVFTYRYEATGIRFQPVSRQWCRQPSKEQEPGLHELAADLLAERADALSISEAARAGALAGLTATPAELATLVVTPAGIVQQQGAVGLAQPRREPRRAAPLAANYQPTSPLFSLSALFQYDGQPIIWPGTVNLLHGTTGTHKSRVAGLLASIALAAQAGHLLRADALGFSFHPAAGQQYRVLLVDTSHNLSGQFPHTLQQLKARAGYELAQHPPSFDFISLARVPRAARFAALADLLAAQRRGFDGHLLLVLDCLTDCRPADCSLPVGVARLHELARQYGATVLAVSYLHYQERAAWGRAATVLQLAAGRGAAASNLRLRLVRRAPAAAPLTSYATYCPATQGLVRVAHPLAAPTA